MNKSFHSIAFLAIAGLAAFSSCSNNDDLYAGDQTLKEYEENFKSTFGDIDPNQDWNMATRGSVTVNVPSSSTVQIYTSNSEGTYELIGEYKGVSGTQTLNFDIAKAKSDILVAANGSAYETTVGGTVDFISATKATRTMIGNQTIATVSSDYKVIPESIVKSYDKVVPEDGDNLGKVTQNFKFVSKGAFTIYPMFWKTNAFNALGVYWKDKTTGEYHEQEIYQSKEGDELLVSSTDNLYCRPDNQAKVGEVCSYCGNTVTKILQTWDYPTDKGYQHEYTKWSQPSGNTTGLVSVKSKGITINLPEGTEFGLFINVYQNGNNTSNVYQSSYKHFIRYSEASKNEAAASTQPDNYQQGKNDKGTYVFASYFQSTVDNKTYTFLGFEDWASGHTDLNDLIFMFDTDNVDKPTPTVIDEDKSTESSWIIACEDLGTTGDYDFNDVVLKVTHVSGQTTATVTPLAAGGTLATDVYFNNEKKGEIHGLISSAYATPSNGVYTMLNTDGGANPGPGASLTMDVDPNFSLAASTGEESFGGISLVVHQTTGDDNAESINTDQCKIEAPTKGAVPQMFVVSSNWKWPKEYKHIEAAYPEFSTWVGNAQFNWIDSDNNDSSLIYNAE